MTRVGMGRHWHGLGEAGFTLIELLIAMTILSFVMLILFGSLRFGARVWERSEAHLAQADDVARVEDFLRREIGQAYPYFAGSERTNARVDFEGTAQSVSFIGPSPRAAAGAGRARVTLTVQEDKGVLSLKVHVEPELALVSGKGRENDEDLLTGLKTLHFRYFGQSGEGGPRQWHEVWKDQARLPDLVRIEAEFEGPKAPIWPVLIIAPVITVDVNCVYDQLTRGCQGR